MAAKRRVRHTSMINTNGALIGMTALLIGCGDTVPLQRAVIQWDSAGVTIVELLSPSENDHEEWELSSVAALQLGSSSGQEPEAVFGRISGAVRLKSGRIAVVDQTAAEVRLFDAGGEHLRTLGGRGHGPGEFALPLLVSRWDADTLELYDRRLQRITVIDEHHHVQTKPSPRPGTDVIAAVGERLLMAHTVLTFGHDGPDASSRPIEYWLVDRSSLATASLGTFTGSRGFGRTDDIGQYGYRLIPFHDRMPSAAPGPGMLAILSDQGRVIRTYSTTGELQRVFRMQGKPRRVTGDDLEGYIAAHTRDLPAAASAFARRMFADSPVPDYWPQFQNLLVDPLGLLWAEEYNYDEAAHGTWWVLTNEGQMRGYVKVPPHMKVTQIGVDFVLGVWRDSMDVQYVRLYQLSRPQPAMRSSAAASTLAPYGR
jgi:hypothetical protein